MLSQMVDWNNCIPLFRYCHGSHFGLIFGAVYDRRYGHNGADKIHRLRQLAVPIVHTTDQLPDNFPFGASCALLHPVPIPELFPKRSPRPIKQRALWKRICVLPGLLLAYFLNADWFQRPDGHRAE